MVNLILSEFYFNKNSDSCILGMGIWISLFYWDKKEHRYCNLKIKVLALQFKEKIIFLLVNWDNFVWKSLKKNIDSPSVIFTITFLILRAILKVWKILFMTFSFQLT